MPSPGPSGTRTVPSASSTGISTSTCFNILRTLTRARFASFNPVAKTYRLGLAMAEMAAGLMETSHVELIRPELERLALYYETLILLWCFTDDNHLVLIDRAQSQTALRVEIAIGYRHPLLAGAVGRCVAAKLNLPNAELRRRYAGLRWQTPIPFAIFQTQVRQAAERGWGMDEGNLFRGITAVGVLASDTSGRPRFGFSGVSVTGQ